MRLPVEISQNGHPQLDVLHRSRRACDRHDITNRKLVLHQYEEAGNKVFDE